MLPGATDQSEKTYPEGRAGPIYPNGLRGTERRCWPRSTIELLVKSQRGPDAFPQLGVKGFMKRTLEKLHRLGVFETHGGFGVVDAIARRHLQVQHFDEHERQVMRRAGELLELVLMKGTSSCQTAGTKQLPPAAYSGLMATTRRLRGRRSGRICPTAAALGIRSGASARPHSRRAQGLRLRRPCRCVPSPD
jgi:hypothetical protein